VQVDAAIQQENVARRMRLPSAEAVCTWSAIASSPPWLSAAIPVLEPEDEEEPALVTRLARQPLAGSSLRTASSSGPYGTVHGVRTDGAPGRSHACDGN
jgi:hypothetical protein